MMPPAYPAYFADPFVLAIPGGYAAYGTTPAASHRGDAVFESLWSPDLRGWEPRGPVLRRPGGGLGDEFWAPEVAHAGGAYWLYYSVGHGIDGHHLRVARSDSPFGPFDDVGVSLTPGERFAIDAHPYRDRDGRWYLFFARDVLDADRPGTHLAVAPLDGMTALAAEPAEVLAPNADWQLYERGRSMYGRRFDWHTLEGPAVAFRGGRYWLTYSGGAWTGPGYAVAWAVADHPLGPWRHAPDGTPPLLATRPGRLLGPGHNSLVTAPDGRDAIAFHAWDSAHRVRQLHVHHLTWSTTGPRVGPPLTATGPRVGPPLAAHHPRASTPPASNSPRAGGPLTATGPNASAPPATDSSSVGAPLTATGPNSSTPLATHHPRASAPPATESPNAGGPPATNSPNAGGPPAADGLGAGAPLTATGSGASSPLATHHLRAGGPLTANDPDAGPPPAAVRPDVATTVPAQPRHQERSPAQTIQHDD